MQGRCEGRPGAYRREWEGRGGEDHAAAVGRVCACVYVVDDDDDGPRPAECDATETACTGVCVSCSKRDALLRWVCIIRPAPPWLYIPAH